MAILCNLNAMPANLMEQRIGPLTLFRPCPKGSRAKPPAKPFKFRLVILSTRAACCFPKVVYSSQLSSDTHGTVLCINLNSKWTSKRMAELRQHDKQMVPPMEISQWIQGLIQGEVANSSPTPTHVQRGQTPFWLDYLRGLTGKRSHPLVELSFSTLFGEA